jgi:DNA invertase Pin-like site-specific DNA recombinase
MSETYAYARVSAQDQNPMRQIDQLRQYVKDDRHIFVDKASGKDFNRKAYLSLVGTETTAPVAREGDCIVLCSLDRLGRCADEVVAQWKYLTETLKVDIQILDMPLLCTRNTTNNLDGKFISSLCLQILSYVAQRERENILARQKSGIASAHARGVKFGRPVIQRPENWDEVYSDWKAGNITAVEAMKRTNLTRCTFYKMAKQ